MPGEHLGVLAPFESLRIREGLGAEVVEMQVLKPAPRGQTALGADAIGPSIPCAEES